MLEQRLLLDNLDSKVEYIRPDIRRRPTISERAVDVRKTSEFFLFDTVSLNFQQIWNEDLKRGINWVRTRNWSGLYKQTKSEASRLFGKAQERVDDL